MKSRLRLVLLVLLSFAIAAAAYFWATGMIDSNYAYRSPLKDTPPQPAASLGEPSTGRLVFVLIDALRYDTSLKESVMPSLASLRQIGASALMHSRPPSFSEPGYSTLLTGAWPEINDGPVFNLDYEEIPTFTQDNLFSATHRSGLETAVSGYYWFEKLIPQSDVDHSFYTPGEDAAADREVVDAALAWLQSTDAALILIHIDQVDYAGHHEGGAASPNWDAAASRSDALLSEILETMDLENETIVVLSDHGQIDAGGHGGQDPIVLLEPFVIAGKGGTGKTSISALLVQILSNKGVVLAIDADPATNLNQALGVEAGSTVGRIREEMTRDILAGTLSPSISKPDYLEGQIRAALVESKGFDLLAIGRPEGPGCYCAVNHILRDIVDRLGRAYDYVIVDNEAGMEHLSRRTTRDVDHLLLVSDASMRGMVAADGDRLFTAQAPRVPALSAIGSGDAFLAGMAAVLLEGGSFVEMLRMGLAASAANTLQVGAAILRCEQVEALYGQAEVVEVTSAG